MFDPMSLVVGAGAAGLLCGALKLAGDLRRDRRRLLLEAGLYLQVRGRTAGSVEAFLELARDQPVNPLVEPALETALSLRLHLDEVIQIYRRITERQPGNGRALYHLGVGLSLAGCEAEAQEAWRRAVSVDDHGWADRARERLAGAAD